jgi:hypothetical protein|tara:strand:+ start:207 stop:389 length:183 start_codon:yes stop_codon:yes gene_type:complete
MADPYPAVGSNYRPNFQPTTTNRGLTLTAEEVENLKEVFGLIPQSQKSLVESIKAKVDKL